MGCSESNQNCIGHEEEPSVFQERYSQTVSGEVTREAISIQNFETIESKWSIMDRIDPDIEIRVVRPKKLQKPESELLDDQQVAELIQNSSPELGGDPVLATILTEAGFTPKAIRNIIVLSIRQKTTLITRVYAVLQNSLKYQFCRKLEVEPIFKENFNPEFCFFDQESKQLSIYSSVHQLCKIDLRTQTNHQNDRKKALLVDIHPQVRGMEDLPNIRLNKLSHKRLRSEEFTSYICDLKSVETKIASTMIRNRHEHRLAAMIGEIRKSWNPSLNLIRPVLVLIMKDSTRSALDKIGMVLPLNILSALADPNQIKSFSKKLKQNLIAFVGYSEYSLFVVLLDIRSKRVVMRFSEDCFSFALAYYSLKTEDAVGGQDRNLDYLKQIARDGIFNISVVYLDPSTLRLIVQISGLEELMVISLRETDPENKFKFIENSFGRFFNIEDYCETHLLGKFYSERTGLNLILIDKNNLETKPLFQEEEGLGLDLNKFPSLRAMIDNADTKTKIQITPLNSSNDIQERVLIASPDAAIILNLNSKQSEFCSEIPFVFQLVDLNSAQKITKDLFSVVKSDKFLYLFQVKQSREKKLFIAKAKKLNLNFLLSSPENGDFSFQYSMCCYQEKKGDYILVLYLSPTGHQTPALIRLRLGSKNLEIKSKKILRVELGGKGEVVQNQIKQIGNFYRIFSAMSIDSENKINYFYKLVDSNLNIFDEFEGELSPDCSISEQKNNTIIVKNQKNGDLEISLWKVKKKKRKFKRVKRRVLKGVRSIGTYENPQGICVLVQPKEETSRQNQEEAAQSLREENFKVKLFSFDVDLNLGMVVYLGKMTIRSPFRADYVSKNEIHFRTDENDGKWYSITPSENL